MAKITFGGNATNTKGDLPEKGSNAPDFSMINNDLEEIKLSDLGAKKKVLSIFPSLDTGVCAKSVREFNKRATDLKNVEVLNISMDLPFAQKRFSGAEGIENAQIVSVFRSDFADTYGLRIMDGKLKGLCSRAVIVLDEDNKVLYTQQVSEIGEEPDYEKALNAL